MLWYCLVPCQRTFVVTKRSRSTTGATDAANDKRRRILHAAIELFQEHGFAAATTIEIATRARVSKRELYASVGNKEEMLVACITDRAERLQASAEMPVPRDRDTLGNVLASFGTQLLREVSEPTVVAVFRLAIAEAARAPEVAQTLDSIGRETSRTGLRKLMARARECGLLDGRPAELAEQFAALLWRDLMLGLLLGVTERPSDRELAARARDAAAAFLRLHPKPNDDAAT